MGTISSPSARFCCVVDVLCIGGNVSLVGRFGRGSCISLSATPARGLNQLRGETSLGSWFLV